MTMNGQASDTLTAEPQTLSPLEQEDAEFGADDLDTEALLAEIAAQEDDAPVTDEEGQEEKPEANGKPKSETPPKESFKEQAKRMGTAEILQKLEANEISGKDAADAVRAMQTKMNQNNVEFKTMKREMEETLRELRALPPGAKQQEESDPDEQMLSKLRPQDRQLMEAYLRKGGYVKQEDLASQKTQEEAANFVNASIEQGLEQYGETFGFRDEAGQFHVNPDVTEQLNSVLERLESSAQGVTPLDLFRLANFESLVEQARKDGRAKVIEEINTKRQQRGQRAIQGQTIQRSGAGNARPKIYDGTKDRGDTGKVIERAWALLSKDV